MSAEAVSKLRVMFEADSSALDKAFSDTERKAGGLSGAFGKVTGALGSIGLAGMGISVITDAVGSAAGAVGGLISSAEALGDAGARVQLVFGEAWGDAIEDQAAALANGLGMTQTAFIDATGAMGQFLTNMGVGKDAAAEMSLGMTELAPKLAAFAGVDTEQAMNALQKGVGGATRGLKEMGIAIPEIPKGLDKAGEAAFIYAQILEQSANAQAAWADNSGDVEVSMQRVSAAIEETKTALGEKLLPLIAPIAEQFASVLPGALETLVGAVGPVVDAFVTNLVPAISTAVDNVKAFIADLKSKWDSDWGGIRSAVEDVMDWWEDNVEPIITEDLQAVNDAIGGFASDWDGTWKGKIEPAVRGFIDFWKSTVAPAITFVLDLWKMEIQAFAAIIAGLSAMWERHGDAIMAIVGPIVAYVVQQFQYLMDFVRAIVAAGSALIQGDFRGFGEALGKAAAAIVNLIVNAFKTTWSMVKSALSAGVAGIVSWLKSSGDNMGKMTLEGLVAGIKSGAGKVYQALKDLASGMIKGFMDNLKIGSPSKVFEELAMWIDAGIAAGISKYDVKAIEAMAKVVQAITSVASGLPDAIKKLAEASIPDDATIAEMEAQFDRMLGIVEKFVKRLSIRAVILGVTGNSENAPNDVKEWLKSAGIDPGSLLNNADVTNVGRLLDATQKVIGTWSQIVDTINKVADMKPLAAGAFAEVEKRSDDLIAAAERLAAKYESTLIVGLTDMATAVKAAAEILSTGASLDLSKAAKVTADQLEAAEFNIREVGKSAYLMVTGWLKVAGDDKARKAWIDSLKDFADTAGAAANILKSGDLGSLADIAKILPTTLETIEYNIKEAGKFAYLMVTKWLNVAGDPDTRRAWIDSLRDYADTLGAAVDIFKAGVDASGKLENITAITSSQLDIIKQNLIDIASNVADLATWSFGFGEHFKAWAENVRTAVDIFRAGVEASKTIEGVSLVAVGVFDIVKQNVIDIASNIQELAKWSFSWPENFKTWTDNLKTALDIFKAGADASKTLTDVSALTGDHVGIVKSNLIIIGVAVKEISAWRATWPDTFKEWADGLKQAVDIFKAGADASKTLKDVTDLTAEQIAVVKFNLVAIGRAMLDVSHWKADWPKDFDTWAKGIGTAVSLFATVAKSLADIGGVSIPDVTGKLEPIKAAVLAMFRIVGEVAAEITTEEAKARADLAEAIARMSKGMGDFGGGISGLMELAESKLFGSDVGNAARGPLSHAQRTRGRRADFFATQLADTVKRAVGAVQDALSGITLTVDDAKVEALAKLGDAFGSIADGLTKLAEAKMPNAEQLAAIMGALSGAQQGMGGLAGAGGGAGHGGPMTLNLSNPSLVFSTPITASVQVTTNPTIQIGTRTIETLASIIEQKLSDRFILGAGGGSPITTGNAGDNHGRGQGKGNNDVNPNRRGWG